MRRWPIIRHVRYYYLRFCVNRHYANWQQLGYLQVHIEHDYAMLERVWRGEM